WTPQRLESGESTGYGIGWFTRRGRLAEGGPVVPIIGHGGASIGGQTSFMIFPEQRIVVAVSTNVTGAESVTGLAGRLAQLFARRAGP
ncbi:MAG TPA: serine hydrolase, partial [Longimicrobium sp.]|uniref:serine hydrolase n=1 Tax=Longimicrobium sp. TaxID=2029185 RepID=UPI002ED9E9E1